MPPWLRSGSIAERSHRRGCANARCSQLPRAFRVKAKVLEMAMKKLPDSRCRSAIPLRVSVVTAVGKGR